MGGWVGSPANATAVLSRSIGGRRRRQRRRGGGILASASPCVRYVFFVWNDPIKVNESLAELERRRAHSPTDHSTPAPVK
uniref:Uncharacterized protein n=1 Tax=Oryza punctata TaxID=4537 RepID=A0A0E0JWL5_ORYPU